MVWDKVRLWAGLLGVATLVACGGGGGGGGTEPAGLELTVTVSGDGGGGTASPGRVSSQPAGLDCTRGSCSARFAADTAVTLTATPAAGQRFTGWTGACTGTQATCQTTMTAARSVGAGFAAVGGGTTYTLTVQVSGSGTVSSQPAGIQCGTQCSASFAADTVVVLTATPATGQGITGWTGACSGAAGTCTLTMSAARTAAVSFAAPPPAGWTDVQLASGPGAYADIVFEPVRTAIDESGQALAVWFERSVVNGPMRLVANRYTPATGWGTPVELAPAVANRSYEEPELALDPTSGRALLAWRQRDGASANRALWSRAFDPTGGWGAAEAVQAFNPVATSGELRVGIDGAGQATAVWVHDPDGPTGSEPARIWANRRAAGGGWGTPLSIGEAGLLNPRLAVAPNGTAVAVWGGGGGSLWSSQSSGSAAWSTPTELVKSQRGQRGAYLFDVAMNASGEGLLVWQDFNAATSASTYTIQAKRFLQSAWQTADLLVDSSDVLDTGFAPKVALNAHGHSVIVWEKRDHSLRAAVGLPGQAWGVSTVKPADPQLLVRSFYRLQAGIDGLGHALLAWTQSTSGTNPDLVINRYTPAGGWAGPTLHETYTGVAEVPISPALAVNDRGEAMLAWWQSIHKNASGTEVDQRIVSRFYRSGR